MAISTQTQNLNLIPGKSAPVVVHLSQGNVGNTVQFYLYNGTDPYIPSNVSIAVHGVRANGSVFGPYPVTTTTGSNLVSFSVVSAMTSVNGAAVGELVLTDSNQNQIGTANFGMLVEAAPYSSSVTYEDDLSVYQRILAYVQSNNAATNSRINFLQTEIDQIVAPTGEAPSAAEVQNARIDVDGKVHDTLGNAIRSQVSDLVERDTTARSGLTYGKDVTSDLTSGYYITTNVGIGGTVDFTPISNSSFKYIIVDCIDGDKFVVTGSGGNAPRLWAFVDHSNKVITLADTNASVSNTEITAPTRARKAIFNVATYSSYRIYCKNAVMKVEEFVNKKVHPIEQSLYADKSVSNNFNPGYINLNVNVGSSVNLTPVENSTVGYKIIDSFEGLEYRISGYSGNASRLWGFLDVDNKLLSVESSNVTIDNKTIIAPENTSKMVINDTYSIPTIAYLCDAEIAQDIAERLYGVIETAKSNKESISNFTFASRQLFDRYSIVENKAYSSDKTSIVDDSNTCLSDFIPVESGTFYTVLACVGDLLFFTEDKQFIASYRARSYETTEQTTPPSGAAYLRLQMNKYFYPYAQTMVVKGTSLSSEIKYGKMCNKKFVETPNGYEFSSEPVPDEYSAIGIKAIDGTQDFDDDNPSVSQLYAAYDALVEAYPDYISRVDFGMDQSNTYHMYAYYFVPEDVPTQYKMYRKPYPKINLRSGIHGNGTLGDSNINLFCLYYLMKSICENWRESEALSYLRWNVRFAVMPLQNPWGFEHKTRYNSRGVDINRNFSVGWHLGQSGKPDYGGSTSMSEAETNNIVAFEQANPDAIFTFDVHSQAEVPEQEQMTYTSLFVESDMFYVAKSLVTKMSHVWDSQNIRGLTKKNYHGYVACEFDGWGTGTSYIQAMLGKPSMTIEGFKNFSGSGYANGSAEIVKMVADQLGYGILLGLRRFSAN